MYIYYPIILIIMLMYAALILYYRAAWLRLQEESIPLHYSPSTSLSIIIPARNEAHNLPGLIKDIQAQLYPGKLVQIIVVDDHSDDDTQAVLQQFSNIHVIRLSEEIGVQKMNAYKKKAIEVAITHACGDWIVSIDADCSVGPYWLLSLAHTIETKNVRLIAGPVVYEKSSNWFETFQSLDFATMQGITGAVVSSGSGSMCNGANLAYSKIAFHKVKGFEGIDHIASGDDMLLMQKIETAYPGATFYLKCRHSIVNTQAVQTISDFFRQRIRWASKAKYYKDKRIQWVLLLVYLFNFQFLFLCISSFFNWVDIQFLFLLLLFKTIIEWQLLSPVLDFFDRKKELKLFPFLQVLHIPYIILSGMLGYVGIYTWKNRKVR